jgi:hypothetical protein
MTLAIVRAGRKDGANRTAGANSLIRMRQIAHARIANPRTRVSDDDVAIRKHDRLAHGTHAAIRRDEVDARQRAGDAGCRVRAEH